MELLKTQDLALELPFIWITLLRVDVMSGDGKVSVI
jgi:hypothetical protein